MKTFLKTLIGGALSVGALYVVGKICYEAGRESVEIEKLLDKGKELSEETDRLEQVAHNDLDIQYGCAVHVADTVDETPEDANHSEMDIRPTIFGRTIKKIKNAKLFLTAKKAFDRSNRSPGILSSLLTNPDGARIEAYVRDGGIQISVKPRAA